jgi:hypothetical protein
MWQ